MVDYGEKLVWSEEISIDEMYATRSERQMNVLLEKARLFTLATTLELHYFITETSRRV